MTQKINWNDFKQLEEESSSPSENYFSKYENLPKEDTLVQNITRSLYQPIGGAADISRIGIGASLWDLLGTGESLQALNELGEERIKNLKEQFPSAPWENYKAIDKEKYLKNLEEARQTLPTISNIEKFIEKHTGIPLEPQNFLQKLLRIGGTGFKISPGSLKEKTVKGIAAAGIKGGLQTAGVPEPIADISALAPTAIQPRTISKASGLPSRWYEKIKSPTTISHSQYKKLVEAIENDIRGISNDVIQKHNSTAKLRIVDPLLRDTLSDAFDQVTQLSQSLPSENLSGETLRKFIVSRIKSRPKFGITSSSNERAYRNEMTRLLREKALKPSKELTQETKILDQYGNPIKKTKKIPAQPINNKQLLEQYRKTNMELKNYFEPSKSKGINIGKRDALLDYNRAIGDLWEKRYPDSEFNRLFKETNKIYSELADLENVDHFFNEIFNEPKINYRTAKKFLDDPKIKDSFKKVLGDSGYTEMKSIFRDFIPTEQVMSLIKQGEKVGINDMAKYVKRWVVSPLWAKFTSFKNMSKIARNSLLSNQQFMITWKSALKDLKNKNFEKAIIGFQKLDKMADEVSTNQSYRKTNQE